MSKPPVLLAVDAKHGGFIWPEHALAALDSVAARIAAPAGAAPDKAFLLAHIGPAEVLVTSWGTAAVDAEILAAAPGLKLVAHAAGTVKPIMTEAAWARGLRATSAAQAIALGVAEFCLGMMLTAPKRVYWLADRVRQGYWRETLDIHGPAFELHRQNIGIIGAGFVGRRLIELLKPFTCTVRLYDPYCPAAKARALGAEKVETLDELFATCRVVNLVAPSTPETKGMIRGRHFAQMREGSVFINVAPGVVIHQEEMLAELQKGRVIACLDATFPEPPPVDSPLRRLPNVLITPHEAGVIRENLMRIGEFVAQEISAYVAGRPLQGEVTAERLRTIA